MKTIFLSVMMLLSTSLLFAQADKRQKEFNLDKSHLAIQGYDPVAYFKQGKAIEGSDNISFVNNGVTYRFATAQNRDLFKAAPSAYEPQYGGWCAYAMGSTGEKVAIDPGTFKIVDNKLYLFYNKFFNNTLKSWNKDEASLKTKADANWSKTYHS